MDKTKRVKKEQKNTKKIKIWNKIITKTEETDVHTNQSRGKMKTRRMKEEQHWDKQ